MHRPALLALLIVVSCSAKHDDPAPDASSAPEAASVADTAAPADDSTGAADDVAFDDAADTPPGPELTPLIVHTSWMEAGPAEDPFDDRPESHVCAPSGLLVEDGIYEVDTDGCEYMTAWQPSLASVAAGDRLIVTTWHLNLAAPEPATGHMAVRLGDVMLLDEHVPIPSLAKLYEEEVVADFDAPAGTPVYFHIHNHGTNSWRLLSVLLEPAAR